MTMSTDPNRAQVSIANLRPGGEKDVNGRFTTSRSEMGREHALAILNDPDYREMLAKRMKAGEGGAIEVWIWRIGYGDPPKAREDSGEDEARFLRMRERLRAFMRENPEEARVAAAMLAQQPRAVLRSEKDADPAPVG
jgi:hypothetical protein